MAQVAAASLRRVTRDRKTLSGRRGRRAISGLPVCKYFSSVSPGLGSENGSDCDRIRHLHRPWGTVSTTREAFEGVQANAQWADDHDFVWFSVMDHLIQIRGA